MKNSQLADSSNHCSVKDLSATSTYQTWLFIISSLKLNSERKPFFPFDRPFFFKMAVGNVPQALWNSRERNLH